MRHRRLAVLLLALLGGCGAARTEGDLSAAFARIQVEEARIEHAGTPRDRECDEEEADCAEIADASGALCTIADEIDDRDALARCDRARERGAACASAHAARCSGATAHAEAE